MVTFFFPATNPQTVYCILLLNLYCFFQGHETSALLILEKITDRNLINATNSALQTYASLVLHMELYISFNK